MGGEGGGLSEAGFWRKWGAGELGEVSRGLGYMKVGQVSKGDSWVGNGELRC